jgi:hypothetical protein
MRIGGDGNAIAQTRTDLNRGIDAVIGRAAANNKGIGFQPRQRGGQPGLPEAVAGGFSNEKLPAG